MGREQNKNILKGTKVDLLFIMQLVKFWKKGELKLIGSSAIKYSYEIIYYSHNKKDLFPISFFNL